MKIKNIIFDWSGVISDDFNQVFESVNETFVEYGMKKISAEEFKENFCLPYINFYLGYMKNPDIEDITKKFKRIFKTKKHPEVFVFTKNILDYLKSKKINMVLLSSHHFVEEEIKKHFPEEKYFLRIFEKIIDKEKVIEDIMKEMKFNSDETIYVGDMVHDIDAGKRAGVKTVAVLSGYDSKEKLEKAKPYFIFKDIRELKKIV